MRTRETGRSADAALRQANPAPRTEPGPSVAPSAAPLAEALSRGTLHLPEHAYPRNEAIRPPRLPLTARLAAWLGLAGPGNQAARAALLGASGLGGTEGAPLAETVGRAPLAPDLALAIGRVRAALAEGEGVQTALEALSPLQLARVDAAFGEGHGGGALSLREALGKALRGGPRRKALATLEAAHATVRRADGPAPHDLALDPTGFAGPAHDGRLPQTIDKLLELRRLGFSSRADLVNHHELVPGNRVTPLAGGEQAFAALLRAVDEARDFIHLSFFIFKDDAHGKALAEHLIARRREGVTVRVAFDDGGDLLAGGGAARRLASLLEGAGVEVVRNRLVDPSRATSILGSPDHRKMVVVDGRVAFTGGLNIGSDYIGDWRDHLFELQGPAVHQLGVEWLIAWLSQGGRLDDGKGDAEVRARYFPPAPAAGSARVKVAQTVPGESDEIRRAYLEAIAGARRSISIESPYVSSPDILAALLAAVKERGVRVELLIPGDNNHPASEHAARPGLRALVEAGASVYAYPGMLHAKVMLIDEQRALLGSANLDELSLRRVFELNLHVDDEVTAQRIAAEVFAPDRARATRLSHADLERGAALEELFFAQLRGVL